VLKNVAISLSGDKVRAIQDHFAKEEIWPTSAELLISDERDLLNKYLENLKDIKTSIATQGHTWSGPADENDGEFSMWTSVSVARDIRLSYR
jgi:hypothetical protein